MSRLLEPLVLGDVTLANRIVMAPLTRCRAGDGHVPTALNAEYYAQRADCGLILTEATVVSAMGIGYPDTPGLWSETQVEGWKAVTRAVHATGGKIFAQLWHVGRISHPDHLGGALPVAPSAVKPAGHVVLLRPKRDHVTPRALDIGEIPGIVADYGRAAANARKAGFDGVEIHAANGYLIDQFLQDKTNKRADAYGGPIENRARFLMEIVDACVAVWGPGRVGVHLAPRGDANDAGDSDPRSLFTYVAGELGKRRLAFIFLREHEGPDSLLAELKQAFGGVVIANEGFTPESAEAAIAEGRADAVAWGRGFIANPDLVARIGAGAPWNELDMKTIYGIGGLGPVGYTDYPRLGG